MKQYVYLLACCMWVGFFGLFSCTVHLPKDATTNDICPDIFPDYKNVTVPVNIAPLNFKTDPNVELAQFRCSAYNFVIKAKSGSFSIPVSKWRKLLGDAVGDSVEITLYGKSKNNWQKYAPFVVHVSQDKIDSYLVYRKIAPGYRMWNQMGIYQRNLENFNETAIIENKTKDNNCMNCHSFNMQRSDTMFFHQRGAGAGSYFLINGHADKIKIKYGDNQAVPGLTYPAWHPSGRFMAFSSNDTHQDFHVDNPNRIEVFDNSSDIYIYDVESRQLFSSPLLKSDSSFETYPTFSPDGKYLYFCSAEARTMPKEYDNIKYNLLRIGFNAQTKTIGSQIDTLFDAHNEKQSAKFQRISPDGRKLLFTVSDYGNFSIWHKDADLRLFDLDTETYIDMNAINSNESESYHSWSSGSDWIVFSSRRLNGLYTSPYICHIDKEGKPTKPFLLPQRETDFYDFTLFSFNIPELVKNKIIPTH